VSERFYYNGHASGSAAAVSEQAVGVVKLLVADIASLSRSIVPASIPPTAPIEEVPAASAVEHETPTARPNELPGVNLAQVFKTGIRTTAAPLYSRLTCAMSIEDYAASVGRKLDRSMY